MNIKQFSRDNKWLVCLGASMRGLIPRRDDKIISFLEIGTEKAYKQKKADSVANFFISMTTALALFFMAVFTLIWSLLVIMQNNYNKQISSFNLSPSAENASMMRDKASHFNAVIEQASSIAKKEAKWSKIIEEIKSRTIRGVTISQLSLPGGTNVFSLSGTTDPIR